MSSSPAYEALLHGVAYVRRTDRAVIRVRGGDGATWLQGLVTNDVLALHTGRRIYSACLTPQGRMITDLWIAATGSAWLLDVPASLAAGLAARLDGLVFTEDVQIDDASGDLAVVQVFGAARIDRPAAVLAVEDLTYGVRSTVLYLPPAAIEDLVRGSIDPVPVEVTLDDLEVLRVEAGVPRFLVDMTADTIPLEAGLEDRAISFTKGCYVGQEIIVRITSRGGGRVARRLAGLRLDGSAPPPAGAAVHDGPRVVGRITSAVVSPRCAGVIALGYVHRDAALPGTRLEVRDGALVRQAVVATLPFVPPAA